MANSVTSRFEQILGDIHKRKLTPLYFLEGEETYYLDEIVKAIEETVLKPEEKSFNQTVVYGKDISPVELKMAARRYPMMSEYQVLIVKEAQNFSKIDDLDDYFEKPNESTILVFSYMGKKLDKRKRSGKLLSKYTFFTSERLRDYEIVPWIENYIRKKGKNIDPKATQLIADFLGSDLSKICNEIDKMLINLKDEVPIINTAHVEQNIGISKDYNIFELQKALGKCDFNKSVQIANYFAANEKLHPPISIIAGLYSFFSKIYIYHTLRNKTRKEIASALNVNEFFVDDYGKAAGNYPPVVIEDIFGFLKYYDLRCKGVDDTGSDKGRLIIELVVRILRVREIPAHLRIA